MTNKVYGYIRVSTREQNIERQLISLIEAGIERKSIYIDKQSGKDFRRPAYKKMMRKVREGDLIVVKSIDRLGRNYQDIMLLLSQNIKIERCILILGINIEPDDLADLRKSINRLDVYCAASSG